MMAGLSTLASHKRKHRQEKGQDLPVLGNGPCATSEGTTIHCTIVMKQGVLSSGTVSSCDKHTI